MDIELIELSAPQAALLASLLQGNTLTKAASDVGINVKTAGNWKRSKPFKKAYREAVDEMLGGAIAISSSGLDIALKRMIHLADNAGSESIQLRASAALVNSYHVIAHDTKKEASLNELEESLDIEEDDEGY